MYKRQQVTGRVKEAYSTWNKLLREHEQQVWQLSDAIALRVVVTPKDNQDAQALCYQAQQLCQQRLLGWSSSSSSFARTVITKTKDYIKSPKANGYQSLHTAARLEYKGLPWNVEVQIRSNAMHQKAEFGACAHWDYKQQQDEEVQLLVRP